MPQSHRLKPHPSGQNLHLALHLPSLGRDSVRHLHSAQAARLPCRGVSEEELEAVVARVDAAGRAGTLERWAQEDAPTAVMPPGQEPAPGTIEGRRHWPELDVTMLELGNGMKASLCRHFLAHLSAEQFADLISCM